MPIIIYAMNRVHPMTLSLLNKSKRNCLSIFVCMAALLEPYMGSASEIVAEKKTPPYINAADYGIHSITPGDSGKVAQQPDSTDAIQAALDAGAGGTVFLPKGCYRVTRPLSMKAGTTFMGEGLGGTVLTSEKPMTAVIHLKGVSGPMTVIRDLFFAAPLGGNWQCDAIFLDGTNGITIRDCWFGAWRRAVRIEGVSDHWLRNLVFELNKEGIVVTCSSLGRWHGNLRLLDCYGYQNSNGAIRIENVRGVQCQSCSSVGSAYFLLLKNCQNVAVSGANVNWDGSPYARFGLRLENCSLATVSGCNVDGQKEVGLEAIASRLLTVSGNVINGTREGPAMRLERCARSTISNNVLAQSATHGIHISDSSSLVLSQNVIDDYGHGKSAKDAAACHGILGDGECKDSLVADNIIKPAAGAGEPIELTAGSQSVKVRVSE